MDETLLRDLEARVSVIEERVLSGHEDDGKLMKVLNEVNETLTAFSTKRERFNQIFKKVPALMEYLSPGFIDTVAMNKECEKEIVLSAEKELTAMAQQFKEIDKLSEFLDSQKILEVSSHQAQLSKLEMVQHQQVGAVTHSSEELDNLLVAYNELATKLSSSFVKWDMLLSKLEGDKEEE